MGRSLVSKFASLSFVSLAAAFAVSPAVAAGSCGGFYPVDAPTTLSKVAQACRVSLASLREANPGVNPGYVRPGEHLAVPTGIGHNGAPVDIVASNDAFNKIRAVAPFAEDRGFRARTRQRIRILAAGVALDAPSWLNPGAAEGGHYNSSAPLSFQKIAALRIETASVQFSEMPLLAVSGIPGSNFSGAPVISRGYRLPDYSKIGVAPPVLVTPSQAMPSLTGEIVGVDDGCFFLKTAEGEMWRLDASSSLGPVARQIVGATVTVWGATSTGEICDGGQSMTVSHAIYAERWVRD